MKRSTRIALFTAGVTVATGATVGALWPSAPAHETAGSPAVTSVTATPTPFNCEEDDPCWDPKDCASIGNKVCGLVDDAGTAWKVWEREDGARKLKVDPSRPYRVDYMASSDEYPQNMDGYDLALVGTDGKWYVFRATYLDKQA